MITPDLLFSYWLLLWYILYRYKVTIYSPKIWFIIALIYIGLATIYMLYIKINLVFISIFLCISFFVKVIPLYIIRKDKYKTNDFLFGLLIAFIYWLWALYRKKNIIKIYTVDLLNGQSPIIFTIKLFY